jgi:hypothetical protein
MEKPLLISSLLAVAAALIAIGCGGEATLSKAEFIKRADAICGKVDEAQVGEYGAYVRTHPAVAKKLNELTVSEKQPEGIAARQQLYRAIIIPSILQEAEDIEALGAPDGDEETIEEFLAGVRKGVKEAEQDPSKLDEDLPNGAGKNPEYSFWDVNRLAHEYGFKQCNEVA